MPTKKKSAPKKPAAKTKVKVAKKKTVAKRIASNVVLLPKPRRASFNLDRDLEGNSLLKNQVDRFHQLEQDYPERLRSGIPRDAIRTEGQAADYIRRVTLLMQRQAAPQTKKQGS